MEMKLKENSATSLVTPTMPAATQGVHGQRGPYLLVQPLYRGARTQVTMAHDTQLERSVVLKMPVDERRGPQRYAAALRAEARLLANFNHPNIVDLYTIAEDDTGPYLVMEYLAGETLAARLGSGPMTPDTAVDLFDQLLNGLDAVHRLGIVHGDLVPANIFITSDNRAKILDFGAARIEAYADGGNEQPQGDSLPYHAPERLHDSVCDVGTDIYMAGMLLYHSVCGCDAPPIDHAEPNPRLAALPQNLRDTIVRATAAEPYQRFRSAAVFRAALTGTASAAHLTTQGLHPVKMAWAQYRGLTRRLTKLPGFYVDAALIVVLLGLIVTLGLVPTAKPKPAPVAAVERIATAPKVPRPPATQKVKKNKESAAGARYHSLRKAWGTE